MDNCELNIFFNFLFHVEKNEQKNPELFVKRVLKRS